jgi:hypothetical protein
MAARETAMSEYQAPDSFELLRRGGDARPVVREAGSAAGPKKTGQQVTNREWSDIPWFRKARFLAGLLFLFPPGYLLMIWTGDVWYRRNGNVYQMSLRRKLDLTLCVVLLMAVAFTRSFR